MYKSIAQEGACPAFNPASLVGLRMRHLPVRSVRRVRRHTVMHSCKALVHKRHVCTHARMQTRP